MLWDIPASACFGNPCIPPRALPADGATIPANVSALEFTLGSDAEYDGDTYTYIKSKIEDFQLLKADGTPLPKSVVNEGGWANGEWRSSDRYLIIPHQPLEEGQTYRIKYPRLCSLQSSAPTELEEIEQVFRAGPTVIKPTEIGTAEQTGHRIEKINVVTQSGTCNTEIMAALAHVELALSPEMRAYLAVADIWATVDEQRSPAPVINYVLPTSPDGPIEFDVYAGCIVEDEFAEKGLDPGEHKLLLEAHIIGEPTAPGAISAKISLRCEKYSVTKTSDAGQSSTQPDSGSNANDAGYNASGSGPTSTQMNPGSNRSDAGFEITGTQSISYQNASTSDASDEIARDLGGYKASSTQTVLSHDKSGGGGCAIISRPASQSRAGLFFLVLAWLYHRRRFGAR